MQQLSGQVIGGGQLARKLGFPTANIPCHRDDISNSVFAVNVILSGKIYRGVGTYQAHKHVFEVHIFDFSQDIYGQNIEIILLAHIRENRIFSSIDALKEQIHQDVLHAQNIDIPVLTFGSFDYFHAGHAHYLSEAKKYGTRLITIVATDENIEKIKGRKPLLRLLERVEILMMQRISDEVIAGNNSNPYIWLEKYRPKIIALGYDQAGNFTQQLPQKLQDLGLSAEIIRISSYKPETYKSSILKKTLD